jgi:lipopolysaccharide export system permease protein
VGMVFVTLGLTCVIWLSQSLRFVEMIVNRGLTAGTFVYLTMLLLPNFLSIILPIALFAVVLFVYSKMIADRELVVMQASGSSQLRLTKPALILSALVIFAGYILNIYLLPSSYAMFRDLQWNVRHNYSHIMLQEGVFNTVAKGVTIYVRERTKEGEFLGLLIHDGRKEEQQFTLMAERGALLQGEDGSRVVMHKGNRQAVDKKTHQLSILYFDRYTFDFDRVKKDINQRHREARERTVSELLHPERDASIVHASHGKFIVEGHKRLVSPLSSLGFVLVAVASLVTGGIRRRGQGSRIVIAVIIFAILQAGALGLENLAARAQEVIPLMYANVIIPIFVGFYFVLRSPNHKVPAAP